jgi:hypothetical protein
MHFNWQYLLTFKKILQELLDCSIDENISLFDRSKEYGMVCGFKHPPEQAHVFFAEALYDKIINTKN